MGISPARKIAFSNPFEDRESVAGKESDDPNGDYGENNYHGFSSIGSHNLMLDNNEFEDNKKERPHAEPSGRTQHSSDSVFTTTHNYNVRDLDKGDADESNDIGRRNFTLVTNRDDFNPESKRKKRNEIYLQAAMDILEANARRMEQLEIEIKALEEEKAQLEDRLDAYEEIQDLLNDESLNDDSFAGRGKREKLKRMAAKVGINVDDYIDENGKVDTVTLKKDVSDLQITDQQRIQEINQELSIKYKERAELVKQAAKINEARANGDPVAAAKFDEMATDIEDSKNLASAALAEENKLTTAEKADIMVNLKPDGSTMLQQEAEIISQVEAQNPVLVLDQYKDFFKIRPELDPSIISDSISTALDNNSPQYSGVLLRPDMQSLDSDATSALPEAGNNKANQVVSVISDTKFRSGSFAASELGDNADSGVIKTNLQLASDFAQASNGPAQTVETTQPSVSHAGNNPDINNKMPAMV